MGTNTFLLLVAKWDAAEQHLSVLEDRVAVVRLGENVARTGRIRESSIERAIEVVKFYNNLCLIRQVALIWMVGTEVFRRSLNAIDVVEKLRKYFTAPSSVVILSPAEEARLSLYGAVFGDFPDGPITVVDIGGGSTEIVYGSRMEINSFVSIPIGAVWLQEHIDAKGWDIQESMSFVSDILRKWLPPIPQLPGHAYAVAGTPITLAGLLAGLPYQRWWEVHGALLTRHEVTCLLQWLWNTPIEERRRHPAIHPQRADILPGGTLILAAIMEALQLSAVRVSIYGLRYGALYEKLKDWEGVDIARLGSLKVSYGPRSL
ncbi:MAG: hypothetical protein NZ960_03105 [Candidatus Kapabacteria bacterium]|nr:hypothetical protein [Candidatus Kapabacteria bacterium]MDW8012351.1 hypothetical protein [Bacteroidota bacterium]